MDNQTLEQAIQQVIAGINQKYMPPPVPLQQQIAEFLKAQEIAKDRADLASRGIHILKQYPNPPLEIKIGNQPSKIMY